MIQLESVTFTYAGESTPALSELDLAVSAGELCAVLGASGSGKSTLCSLLAGFVPHFFRGTLVGRVRVDGIDVPQSNLAEMSEHVGSVFQNPFNQVTGARFTVREEIGFALENLGIAPDEMHTRIDRSLSVTGLAELAERSPYALSGGQQQRLAIASILAMQAPTMVLDEPTSQLDSTGARDVFSLLRSLVDSGRTTVILAEQRLEWIAAIADRCIVLQAGRKIAEGPPAEVLSHPQLADWGLPETRFSRAARQAVGRGLAPSTSRLPQTLEQAEEYFR